MSDQPSQQPAPQQPPPAFLRLTVQGNQMTSSMITPSITLDGYPLPAQYGTQVLPIYPGDHVAGAYVQWIWAFGKAEHRFHAAPGQTVDVFYRAPALTFMPGAMGPEQQKINGLGALLGCLGAVFVVMLLAIVLVVLASAL